MYTYSAMKKANLKICVNIDLNSVDMCESCCRSIKVDNVDIPKCIKSIDIYCRDNILVLSLDCEVFESRDILTIWSTIDDIVRCVKAAITSIREVERKRI